MTDNKGGEMIECTGCTAALCADTESKAINLWNQRKLIRNIGKTKPLTIERLKQMVGEPVWDSLNKTYALIYEVSMNGKVSLRTNRNILYSCYPDDDHKLYPNKPEGE